MSATAQAIPTVTEYRFFRALSIDLRGRIPTRAELAEFESGTFRIEDWLSTALRGDPAADRLRRIYADRLRLDVGNIRSHEAGTMLRRITIRRADGRQESVYFRQGQRRVNAEIDGIMCFTAAELGVQYPTVGANVASPACNSPRVLSDQLVAERTVLVKPWWLYRDYRAVNPSQRYNSAANPPLGAPGFELVAGMIGDSPSAPFESVRICREEAQTSDRAPAFVRTTPLPRDGAGCDRRIVPIPTTNAEATRYAGAPLDCGSQIGVRLSVGCGCGVGLERCYPGTGTNTYLAGSFVVGQSDSPLGQETSFERVGLNPPEWIAGMLSHEPNQFMAAIFRDNRDIRDLLQARDTMINGPLASFYRHGQNQACCDSSMSSFGYSEPVQLFDSRNVPPNLLAHDVLQWQRVSDRGPLASGILTMPAFLLKYGTRRARAHALYQSFLCSSFVAPDAPLEPSTEVNLTRRSGCAACHAVLEPLAAYFTRIQENRWTYLPAIAFPLDNAARCARTAAGILPPGCARYYDPAFTDGTRSLLRGLYELSPTSPAGPNAERGAPGMANYLVTEPRFAGCVVDTISESLLGRRLDADDAALRESLVAALRDAGFRPRAMLQLLLLSDAYRSANNLSATAWREGMSR